MSKIALAALLVLWGAAGAPGAEIGGVSLPESIEQEGQRLVLNGAGVRKKFFVKVYAAGLYLQEKGVSDPQEIMDADRPMAVRMHTILDAVSADQLKGAWNDGFKKATRGDLAPLQSRIDRFNALFSKDSREGDVHDVFYRPGQGIVVSFNGTKHPPIEGLDFKKAVFGIWLCDDPVDKALKKALLGQ